MKTRESSIPDEQIWSGFFDPPSILAKLDLTTACGDVVDFGCGHGTFTIPAAHVIQGTAFAIDIDPAMIASTKKNVEAAGLHNVQVRLRDFVADGAGLPEASIDYAMLFNILHAECPTALLEEAYRLLSPGGKVGIIHWNYDDQTPRGPSMTIRPRPAQCTAWAEQVGFSKSTSGIIDLPPYHYGIVMQKENRE